MTSALSRNQTLFTGAVSSSIAVVDTISGGASGGITNSTFDVTLPTCSDGDLLVVVVDIAGTTSTLATPAGWTLIDDIDPTNTGLYFRAYLFGIEAVSATHSDAALTLTVTGYSPGRGYAAAAIENADVSAIGSYDVASSSSESWSTSVPFPSLSTTTNDLVVRCGAHAASALTSTAGLTVHEDVYPYNGICLCTDDDGSVEQFTAADSGGYALTFTLAVPQA